MLGEFYKELESWRKSHPFDIHEILYKFDESPSLLTAYLVVDDSYVHEASNLTEELKPKLLYYVNSLHKMHFDLLSYSVLGAYNFAMVYQVSSTSFTINNFFVDVLQLCNWVHNKRFHVSLGMPVSRCLIRHTCFYRNSG